MALVDEMALAIKPEQLEFFATARVQPHTKKSVGIPGPQKPTPKLPVLEAIGEGFYRSKGIRRVRPTNQY